MSYQKKQEERLPPISADRKDYLFGCLLRLPALFVRARDLLKPSYMESADDVPYVLLWQAAVEVASRNHGVLPETPDQARIQIELEAKDLATGDPDTVTEESFNYLFGSPDGADAGLIAHIYTSPVSEYSETEGGRLLRRYLEEVTIYSRIQRAASSWSRGLPPSIAPFLEKISEQKARIATLSNSPKFDALPKTMERPPIEIHTTGVSFIDHFMRGGSSPGEVYTLMGPTGSGKTTLAVQLAVEGALYEQARALGEVGKWYYFTYESPVEPDTYDRVLAYMARVDEDSIKDYRNFSSVERNDYKPYELSLFRDLFNQGKVVPGEAERVAEAYEKIAGKNLHLVDYSGSVEGAGAGGVDEIAAFLEQEQYLGNRIAGVVIDYAGVAVDRYLMGQNIPATEKYTYLARYVNEVRIKVAARFKPVTWVLHQLHGETTKGHHSKTFHHSEALGCRNFGDNAWFCFNIGNQDVETKCFLLSCSKSRRAPKLPEISVMLEGGIRRMTTADVNMALDKSTREYVPTDFQKKVLQQEELIKAAKKKKPHGFGHDPAIGV